MADGICPFAEWIPGVRTKGPAVWDIAGFCDHTAAGFLSTMRNPNFWNNAGVSAHFAIGRQGQIIQLVSIFEQAWCQGRDMNGNPVGPGSPGITWAPFSQMGRRNPNGYLIGVEHEDAYTQNGQTVFTSEWTTQQYDADLAVKRWCVQEAATRRFDALRFAVDSLAGHHMFDPRNRAECPGKHWREQYRQRLYNDLVGVAPPQPSPQEDDMIRHVQLHADNNFTGRDVPPSGILLNNPKADFNLPNDARAVRLEILLRSGHMRVHDGDAGAYAGRIGVAGERYGLIDVEVSSNALTLYGYGNDCVVEWMGCVGYFR